MDNRIKVTSYNTGKPVIIFMEKELSEKYVNIVLKRGKAMGKENNEFKTAGNWFIADHLASSFLF